MTSNASHISCKSNTTFLTKCDKCKHEPSFRVRLPTTSTVNHTITVYAVNCECKCHNEVQK